MDKVSFCSRWMAFIGWGILTSRHLSSVLRASRYVAASFFITILLCSVLQTAVPCIFFACARLSCESYRADSLWWWGTGLFLAGPSGLLSDWFLFTRLQIRKYEQLADVPGMHSSAQLDCRDLAKLPLQCLLATGVLALGHGNSLFHLPVWGWNKKGQWH